MFARLASLFKGSGTKRSLDAASTGARWPDAPRARAGLQISSTIISGRAEHYALNNAHGTKIVQSLRHSLVGTGIVPRPQHPVDVVRERLRREWSVYVDSADAEGLADLYGLEASAAGDLATYGEALFAIERDGATGAPQLLRLHPEQLDRSKIGNTGDGGCVVQGVEFGPDGRRKAYWVCPKAPGNVLAGLLLAPQRRPASTIIHIFRPLIPGQVRGLSWFAPVLLPARELEQLYDALLVKAKVSAMYVGSMVDADGAGPGMDGDQEGTKLDTSVEPGSVRIEAPGKRIEWNEPPTSGDAPVLATETLRMMAAGVGVTYEQLTGDYSKVNYSSARAALLEFRRFCESVQHHTLIFQLCRPVWQQFIRWQILKGTISATAYRADPAAFEAVKWLPPAWSWVDPLKDTNAAVTAIKNGLRSRSDVVAEQGYDIEDLDREIAADQAREQRLGTTSTAGGQNAA